MSHSKPEVPFVPGHLRPINITIPTTWTPEQAVAVFELINDLREKIFEFYCCPIQDLLQEHQACFEFYESDAPATDSF